MAQLLSASREGEKSSLASTFPHFGLSNKQETRAGMIDSDALSVFGHLGDAAVDSWEQ